MAIATRPLTRSLAPVRLARLCRRSIDDLALDLTGTVVLTEAATGAYVVTPVLAALAGARQVHAVTKDTRYGAVADVVEVTMALATELGVAERISITTDASADLFAEADIVTNSGHLRPIDAAAAAAMRPGTALPLMFEAWEIQAGRVDLDLVALAERGVLMAGTNERHERVDVFGYLGAMAVAQLADAGVATYRSELALLCDNPFLDSMVRGITAAGAHLRVSAHLDELLAGPPPEALVVALTPDATSVLSPAELERIAREWPGVIVTQFWGDIDRPASHDAGVPVWPADPPAPGHMGVLPSRLGPEPIVRLQAGGLKVAQILRTPPDQRAPADQELLDVL